MVCLSISSESKYSKYQIETKRSKSFWKNFSYILISLVGLVSVSFHQESNLFGDPREITLNIER
jgi:hypothetical protein